MSKLWGGRFTQPTDKFVEEFTASIEFDQRLYAYDEMGGKVTLLEITPAEFKVHGSFAVTEGSGPHWSHPVVANGRLYIRRGEALLCYDVRAK